MNPVGEDVGPDGGDYTTSHVPDTVCLPCTTALLCIALRQGCYSGHSASDMPVRELHAL